MKLSESVKPISYLKAHASEIIKDISANHKTFIITQNGEAKVIVQDLETYEQIKESLALLKVLSQSKKSLNEGEYKNHTKAFRDLRKQLKQIQ
ncbi:MAG: prevent-host-death protein [Planctomycetes bacterium GWF2_40_8]|nr:MAG: prevent-host-death protein [Planctomycetes bacterium GWF2_40_8]OHB88574.1 MAG: prevent-host-death protein [Planctomycetes bacterium RIFCSPHIGHO2_02_FULL_40_12]OHC01265.1 MAG: prevent-host-death protein [Planctomycetes bacterium RIFCSPLOWO2_12_FULL_40_19]